MISKERIIDTARELRRAQKERIAAETGEPKKRAKTHEYQVAKRLGYAVDTYEQELDEAVRSRFPARSAQP
ncbi:hypothetical protein [Massilia sp. TN1-12]|uniref:hypothetical protein n=1 Tax=Massilia paldalensis TaxID=3377675 RepID=UPI00384FEB97